VTFSYLIQQIFTILTRKPIIKIIPLPGVWERDFEKVGGRVTGKYPYRI
jgi:hypothetical protein